MGLTGFSQCCYLLELVRSQGALLPDTERHTNAVASSIIYPAPSLSLQMVFVYTREQAFSVGTEKSSLTGSTRTNTEKNVVVLWHGPVPGASTGR